MKYIALLAFTMAGCATNFGPTQAQIKYGEMYADMVGAQAARLLACYSHHSVVGKGFDACRELDVEMSGLAINREPAGDQALAQLWAFRLDAGDSESRTCVSLIRGKALLPALRALDPKQARQKCLEILAKPYVAFDFPKVDPDNVCHSQTNIRSNLDRIIEQIEAGKTCEPWNID